MANEFIIKNGFHSKGDSQITGSLSITGIADVSASIAASSGTPSGVLLTANNLSDVANAGTSRTNLGVAIGSDVQAHSSVLTSLVEDSAQTLGGAKIFSSALSSSAYKLNNANALSFSGNVLYVGNESTWTDIELGRDTDDEINVNGILKAEQAITASGDILLPNSGQSINFISNAGIYGRTGGSYPGLHIASGTGTSARIWLGDQFNTTGAVTASFLGLGQISNVHTIEPHGNYPLILRGGKGPNDANDGIQMFTGDASNVYQQRFAIEADGTNVDAYFQNINGLGINKTSGFVAELDVTGDINASGDITASKFVGDGSNLTNLPAGSTPTLQQVTDQGASTTNDIQITGSLNVSGSIDIEMPSGSAFTIHEGDAATNYENRLDFFYDGSDPTLEIAARAATSTLILSKDGGGSYKTTLTGLGTLTYKAAGTDYGVQLGTAFKPVATNQQDLGFYNRRWKNLYLYSTNKIGWGTTNANEHAAFAHTSGTGKITLESDVYTPIFELNGPITASAYQGDGSALSGVGTLTGNGTSTRVPFYNGTTSFTTNAAFVYTDGSKRLDLTGISSVGNSPLRLSNLQEDNTESDKGLVIDSSANVVYRTLGTNAYSSTSIPSVANGSNNRIATFSGATAFNGESNLTFDGSTLAVTGNQTVSGIGTFTGAISASSGVYVPTGANVGSFASDWNMIGDRPKIKVAQNLAIYTQNNAQIALFGSNFGSIISGSLTVGGSSALNPTSPVLDGRIDAKNDVVAFSTSDKRLKDNITPIDSALDKVSKIQGIEFDWIPTPGVHGNEGHDVGVLAQQVEAVLPEVVTTRDNGYKAVKYEKIVPLLIESIKELKAEIEELKKGK